MFNNVGKIHLRRSRSNITAVETGPGAPKQWNLHMAVAMIQSLNGTTVRVSHLVGDGDSSCMAGILRDVDSTIEKVEDENHMKKRFPE